MLDRLGADPDFMSKIFFSDEATFHVSGKVNRHNVRIWGSQNPHSIQEHVRDSPKLNVWCGLSQQQVIGPFFFAEKTVCGTTYLDMLEQFFPQIEHLQPNILFQQDGAPPHWFNDVCTILDNVFPGCWIDKVYSTPVRDLRDLRERVIEAIDSIPEDMLHRAWQEIVHRLDIVTVTDGAHVEICYPPYLEAVSSIRNLRTRHAVVIGTHNTWGIIKLQSWKGVANGVSGSLKMLRVLGFLLVDLRLKMTSDAGVAQSAKALVCRSGVAFGSEFDSRLG
ncbi:hypothetical protein ANN_02517 [Periplaneta americana]|uniref:Tc1-like transposase DDE domain-containing protein n=1 Tax=Periplaneta americana TaxID=6978 RepID=A0ABQ8TWJ8_PERAM|nr:hypothetical protein ANN_02517 [Periplaneta americana]